MRKEILITNYRPEKLKEAREIVGLTYNYFINDDDVDIEKLELYETSETITPVDIFLLGYLFNIYEELAKEQSIKKFLSLTSDILFPHPKGLEYQEFIVKHPNFKGMPITRNRENNIGWMTTKDTKIGKERIVFWEAKRKELGIVAKNVMEEGIRKKVAFKLHPTKLHTCLFSGTELSLDYRYPAPNRIDKINKLYDEMFMYYDKDVYELIDELYTIDKCCDFKKVFNIKKGNLTITEIKEIVKRDFVEVEKRGYVSPGAMSNSPDRLDGFHSYNSDIRDVCDTGRRKDNLKKYTQDRRVYEMWSDGDWKKADRLYAVFVKNGVSPDHIGPMSLGFAHRPKFQPMTASENSSKGNRMTLNDVKLLINDEKAGENVVSWHSKFIWDKLKTKVKTDEDALKISSFMRKNLHHVLIVFSIINENGFSKFLEQFLNPEYSYFDYEFIDFDPKTGLYKEVVKTEKKGENQENNVKRYYRIAFEKLVEYKDKDNRKNKIWESKSVTKKVDEIIKLLTKSKNKEALDLVNIVFEELAEISSKNW